jgi:Pyruvate/2-oxoacid:ferredoxin oxidoreductase delta subunit
MIAENTTYAQNRNYSFKGFKNKSSYVQLEIADDQSNCKLSYIHKAGSLAILTDDKEKKQVVDYLLKMCKGCVIINTTNEDSYNFFAKNYPVYYKHEVPIGYNRGFQYHICIKNTINPNDNCRAPNKAVSTNGLNKENIKVRMIAALKAKRRKTDFVDELINSL